MTKFLVDRNLWTEVARRVRAARRTYAAMAYVGQDGPTLLPLKPGDTLVVDMSLEAVRHGATNPKAIRSFIDNGVAVYTSRLLHAKTLIADDVLVVGSANASQRSADELREAAVISDDAAVVKAAKKYIVTLCTDLVRPEYLALCEKEYRPPKFKAFANRTTPSDSRATQTADLWFVGGLRELNLRARDEELMEAAIADAEPSLAKPQTSVVGWIRYPSKPRFKFYDRLRPGDSIIRTMTSNGSKYVYPPAQVIKKRRWVSSQGTPYYLTLLEESKGAEALPWKKFLRLARQTGDGFSSDRAVTRPISDEAQALRLKRLWTSSGKLRQ